MTLMGLVAWYLFNNSCWECNLINNYFMRCVLYNCQNLQKKVQNKIRLNIGVLYIPGLYKTLHYFILL